MRTRDMVKESYNAGVLAGVELGRARERGEPAETIAAWQRLVDVAARLVDYYVAQRAAGG